MRVEVLTDLFGAEEPYIIVDGKVQQLSYENIELYEKWRGVSVFPMHFKFENNKLLPDLAAYSEKVWKAYVQLLELDKLCGTHIQS
jgi:hypothetical protein